MREHLHPGDTERLGLGVAELRFRLDNGSGPTRPERLNIAHDRSGRDDVDAERFLKAAERTEEIETMALDLIDAVLPVLCGGAFAGMDGRT